MLTKSRRSLAAMLPTLSLISVLLLLSLVVAPIYAQPTDFTLRSLAGERVSASALRGKVVVLAFGASWLPLSRNQAQGVQKLADDYSARGVEVFWVSTDSESQKSKNFASDEQLRQFGQKHDLKVRVLRDPDGAVSKELGIDQLPAVIILDRQGNRAGAPLGGLDPESNIADQLASRLDKLL